MLLKNCFSFQSTGWHVYNGSCYFARDIGNGLTWKDGDGICGWGYHQGYLTSIHSQEEIDFITELLAIRGSYWIGLQQSQVKDRTFRVLAISLGDIDASILRMR